LVGWLAGWLLKALRSGHHDQEISSDSPLTSHFIVSVAQGPKLAKLRSLTELCDLRVSVEMYIAPKGPLQWKHCQCFSLTQHNCSYAPRCVACGETHLSEECSTSQQQLECCSFGGNHTAHYRGCVKWKEAKAALTKQMSVEGSKGAVHPAFPPRQKRTERGHPPNRRA
jgi:hypothetical protein